MFSQNDYEIVNGIARELMNGPVQPLNHLYLQKHMLYICQFLLKYQPHLKLLIGRLLDPTTANFREDRTDMELPQHVRVQRFWLGLKKGTTAMDPITIG